MGHLDGGRLLRATGLHGLQLACVRHLEAGLVLGQDLHEGPQLQPPLLLGDPVPAGGGGAAEQGLGPPPGGPPSPRAPCTYSKSVSFFSSATGWKSRFLLLIPSTQTESSLTNLFPIRQKNDDVRK